VEVGLENLYNSEGFGYLNLSQKLELKQLEEKRRNILLDIEKEQRLKSMEIKIQEGDENSKKHYWYPNGKKKVQTLSREFTKVTIGGLKTERHRR
jgi:hypothetical protein